ncbi:MAG: hypothetical protein ACJA2N_001603 [Salibacteraceae bacterium]|jgi:hypothetical protein
MNNNFTFAILTLVFSFLVGSVSGQVHYKQMMNDPSFNYYDVCEAADLFFETHEKGKGSGWKPYQRWKAENESKYYPSGDRSSSSSNFSTERFQAFQLQQSHTNNRSVHDTVWKELGPWDANNITEGYNPGIGRVESFWVNPANTQHLFLGSRSGGFWRSMNGGANWINTTDTLIASGVNTIAVKPTNSDTVLINVKNAANNTTHGIFRSVDGGTNWIESNFNPTILGWGGLGTSDQIFKIVYHPRVQDLIFIGTNRGVFRSDDHLQTWTRLLSTADITDIEFHPTNDSIIYLFDNYYWSNNKNNILISKDQGLSYAASAPISGNGDRKGFIAVSPQAPNNIYFASTNGVWKTADTGQTFNLLSIPTESCDGFAVSDLDTMNMVYGYLNLMGSTDGGFNFVEIAAWANTNPTDDYTHADLRTAECIDGVFYVGTDGYLAKTANNGMSWERLNDGTAIREFYASGVSQSHHNVYMAGSQDNGTSILSENGWIEWNGGDGMEAVVQTLNPDWMMGSWQFGTRQVTYNGGQTRNGVGNPEAGDGDWEAPLLFDPNHQMVVYSFADSIWQTNEFGTGWMLTSTPEIGSISVAAMAENDSKIFAIASGSTVRITSDGGVTFNSPGLGLPNYSVTDIAFDPNHDSTIIVSYNRYNLDGRKVFLSHNLGQNWTNITYNLADMPVRSVVIDHSVDRNIYLGAEIGVYVKSMNGSSWELYSNGLPNVAVKDLEIQYGSNTLKAVTWGRGLWEIPLRGKENHPAILHISITDTPTDTEPKAGYDQNVTAIISYDQTVSSAFVKWSNGSIDLDKTITMSNSSDSSWVTDQPFTQYGSGTDMYFKVFTIGQNNDTTESYRFQYLVRNGQNVNSVMESNFESSVNLYPNPNNGIFKVDLGAEYQNVNLTVYDMTGKEVHQQVSSGGLFALHINLPKGVYFLNAVTTKNSAKFKFVVQ